MDELKSRAGERLEALHVAAKSAAGNGRTRVQDLYHNTADAIRKIREALSDVWRHELIVESRERVGAWARDAVRRIREGAPPLSPVLLYEELVALFKDRVWRRSVLIFCLGAACGGVTGVVLGIRLSARPPTGPHARALHTSEHSVILIEDATAPGAGAGEVLVRVQAFSVCPLDRGVLRGHAAVLRSLINSTPVTVGRGFAGVVLDVGYGVSQFELGDPVWGCVSEWSGGAASELLTIRSSRLSKRPPGLAADAAASLPWAGALALSALATLPYTSDNCKGKRVVITGAASGEGCLLVQLLTAWNAHVSVTSPRHAALALQDLGAQEFLDSEPGNSSSHAPSWLSLEHAAAKTGPWDCVLVCAGNASPAGHCANNAAVLKATAPRHCVVDLRSRALITDRLPMPFSFLFAASFYTFRVIRWVAGCGTHTDWLEDKQRLSEGLQDLAKLVDSGQLTPVLDKVFLPQDFELALAHVCSDDAIGTSVIRFP